MDLAGMGKGPPGDLIRKPFRVVSHRFQDGRFTVMPEQTLLHVRIRTGMNFGGDFALGFQNGAKGSQNP